jgi:preprotein translocase subunit SecY
MIVRRWCISNAAIFALGIMAYISSSIIIQLGAVVPYFRSCKRAKQSREKKNQITLRNRSSCFNAGLRVGVQLKSRSARGVGSIITIDPFLFTVSCIIQMTAGTIL